MRLRTFVLVTVVALTTAATGPIGASAGTEEWTPPFGEEDGWVTVLEDELTLASETFPVQASTSFSPSGMSIFAANPEEHFAESGPLPAGVSADYAAVSLEADVQYVSGPKDVSGFLGCSSSSDGNSYVDWAVGYQANGRGLAYWESSTAGITLLEKTKKKLPGIAGKRTNHIVADCMLEDSSVILQLRVNGDTVMREEAPTVLGQTAFTHATFVVSSSPSGKPGATSFVFRDLTVHAIAGVPFE